MRVVRIYHAGRDAAHRERDRALVAAGVDVTLVVPSYWPGVDELTDEPFQVVELDVDRPGDVNRHRYTDRRRLAKVISDARPDVLDVHEEPFSSVMHQVLRLVPAELPVVGYAAQNIDKRFPPPFAHWERTALGRLDGLYPCSRQAASVAVGKGFLGPVDVLPLPPPAVIRPGTQELPADPVRLLLVGRLVPEKGVLDAVRVAARLGHERNVQLRFVGDGPADAEATALADELGVQLVRRPWLDAAELAEEYASAHLVLAPSHATPTWVEQFGRMAVEAQAAGAVIVGYASGALPEVAGDAGVLVSPGDIDALSTAAESLLADPTRWATLRAVGLAQAAETTWDVVAAGMIGLYQIGPAPRAHLPATARRAEALRRFGPPADTPVGRRPFALPVLRDRAELARPLAAATDALARRERSTRTGDLRVVYLDHIARMSGGELALIRLLGEHPGIDAHVILGEDGPLVAAFESIGAQVEVLPLDPDTRDLRRTELGARGTITTSAAYTNRVAHRLRELEPDIVHTNSLKSGYYGGLAARMARLPHVWHLRDRIAPDYLPPAVVRLTRSLLATLPTVVAANSLATARTAGRFARVVTLYDAYLPVRAPRVEHGELRTLGIVGRLAEWKGQDVALRALALLRDDGWPLQLRIIGADLFGEPEYAARLHALTVELGLTDLVVFTGHIDDVEAELAGLDVLLHTSRIPEPFGQVVLEGLAAGLPVIATNGGGPKEMITDRVDGVLVPADDPAALADAIREVAPAELRAAMGRAAVERAAAFRPEVIGPQLHDLYAELRAHR